MSQQGPELPLWAGYVAEKPGRGETAFEAVGDLPLFGQTRPTGASMYTQSAHSPACHEPVERQAEAAVCKR